VAKVRQPGTQLALDDEDGTMLQLPLAEPTASVMVRDTQHGLEDADEGEARAMTTPPMQGLGIVQDGAPTRWRASGHVEGVGWLQAWGPSLIAAMARLHALAAVRVAERMGRCERNGTTEEHRHDNRAS
jgi:hypothetical protein